VFDSAGVQTAHLCARLSWVSRPWAGRALICHQLLPHSSPLSIFYPRPQPVSPAHDGGGGLLLAGLLAVAVNHMGEHLPPDTCSMVLHVFSTRLL
jgi:hypothetical protein